MDKTEVDTLKLENIALKKALLQAQFEQLVKAEQEIQSKYTKSEPSEEVAP